ncbi:ATPase, F0 complex, subunit J [Lophiotrema nucula]|uniref:ATPase, F0 complex, subunit J n=1 Tax=Lophiotrema nucula TaxID=690887 RepID=A0A6A5YRN7_9PLEO|nr:ATPase, F0 complex, subunit J [Lophiotrema nucula]
MPNLLGRKWPAPIGRVMAPFYVSGLVVLYGVNAFSNTLAATDEFKNDPRNPAIKNQNANGH